MATNPKFSINKSDGSGKRVRHLATTLNVEVWDGHQRRGTSHGSFTIEVKSDLSDDLKAHLYNETHFGQANGAFQDATARFVVLKDLMHDAPVDEFEEDDQLKVYSVASVILLGKTLKIVREEFQSMDNYVVIGKLTRNPRSQVESRRAFRGLDQAKLNNRVGQFNGYYETY